jgi:hypothetical protein
MSDFLHATAYVAEATGSHETAFEKHVKPHLIQLQTKAMDKGEVHGFYFDPAPIFDQTCLNGNVLVKFVEEHGFSIQPIKTINSRIFHICPTNNLWLPASDGCNFQVRKEEQSWTAFFFGASYTIRFVDTKRWRSGVTQAQLDEYNISHYAKPLDTDKNAWEL